MWEEQGATPWYGPHHQNSTERGKLQFIVWGPFSVYAHAHKKSWQKKNMSPCSLAQTVTSADGSQNVHCWNLFSTKKFFFPKLILSLKNVLIKTFSLKENFTKILCPKKLFHQKPCRTKKIFWPQKWFHHKTFFLYHQKIFSQKTVT